MQPTFHGIDFTSAPSRRKPITIATGRLAGRTFHLAGIEEIETFTAFESWLLRPGPWIGGFDFPFGLPRAAVNDMGWPSEWLALTEHCASLGRSRFRTCLDAYRSRRPVGDKYPYRRGDAAAGSHSPIKLVNPPVALMFLEGAPRLLAAGVDIPRLRAGDPQRVALEAYPGFAVRRLMRSRSRVSYKNDARSLQTLEHRRIRAEIVRRMTAADSPLAVRLEASTRARAALVGDGRGDMLDAVLCALQAACASHCREPDFGLPPEVDPVEGWIATVPGPNRIARAGRPFDNRSS